jgi:hypothetical protein
LAGRAPPRRVGDVCPRVRRGSESVPARDCGTCPSARRRIRPGSRQAVEKTIDSPLHPVSGPLETTLRVFPVQFASLPTREELEAQLQSSDIYVQRHAEEMLKVIHQKGRLPSSYPYSLEVWQFGSDLTMVALAGECVVDYDLRLKKELGPGNLWVAGYSNDVFAYIPSLRVLREGGYEGGGAMAYYVQPRSRPILCIPMKVGSDSDLIPVTGSDAMAVMVGAQRRWPSYRA